jgi:CubicO group peptidase (beta-lactamase class C family)
MLRKRRRSALWMLMMLAGVPLSGAPAAVALDGAENSADPVADYVRAEMATQHIPGVALLISRRGQPVRAEGFGLANVELHVPVSAESIFQSGSVGKQFTATAVMMLVEEGKLRLDEPISKYFPEGPAWWRGVTIRRLLSHTAGFTDYPTGFDERRDYSETELLAIVAKIPPAFAPGKAWSYSNLGYLTLGILIHRVTGRFYGDFLHDRIFEPLGMTTARIISESDIVANRCAGYDFVNGRLKNQDWVSPALNTTADGSLYFSVLDLAKWDAALYGETLLKRASLEQMWTPAPLADGRPNAGHYGFGWFIESEGGRRLVEHEGQWQGFETQISRYLDDGLTIVVLTNLGEAKPRKIADGVAKILFARRAGA